MANQEEEQQQQHAPPPFPPPTPGIHPISFTFMQMQEFRHQSLIYSYMAAGLPVPLHLLLPIWKSFAAFLGFGDLCPEPEPGRCRRSDGKKWRCSRGAVPNSKYCHHHMHRGRSSKHLRTNDGDEPML